MESCGDRGLSRWLREFVFALGANQQQDMGSTHSAKPFVLVTRGEWRTRLAFF